MVIKYSFSFTGNHHAWSPGGEAAAESIFIQNLHRNSPFICWLFVTDVEQTAEHESAPECPRAPGN